MSGTPNRDEECNDRGGPESIFAVGEFARRTVEAPNAIDRVTCPEDSPELD